ncbi:MAG TPA: NAD-dependent epimerase/dehydratase family protein [Alphaproteobacteria bacterium]|nr:NAD-dependent epimerase/dehydratase family protein [Alphaproteobacteria bacterium]
MAPAAARLAAVTGATGFLGGHLVAALIAAGWRVRILARRAGDYPQLAGQAVETVLGDLAARAALDKLVDGADAVIHAAGLIRAPDAAMFRAVNVGGTANLVSALNDSLSHAHLILVSSMVAREPRLSAYAESKREGETTLAGLCRVRWSVVRPCAVYGPWDRETLTIFRSAVRGVFPLAGPRGARIALIHASDAARGVVSLCDTEGSGRIFELTDQRVDGYGWDEIADATERAVGNKVLKLPLPALAIHATAAVNLAAARLIGRMPMLTPGKVREIRHTDWGSAAERQPPRTLWQPRIEIREGFQATVSWYRERGWLPQSGVERRAA